MLLGGLSCRRAIANRINANQHPALSIRQPPYRAEDFSARAKITEAICKSWLAIIKDQECAFPAAVLDDAIAAIQNIIP
jgi:hypothetical protein